MKNTILTLLLLSSSTLFAADNIFDRMDKKTAISTGISKLSVKEQNALLAWLESSKKQIIEEDKKKKEGFSSNEIIGERSEISSSIVGEFNGWQGKTTFTLANGQVWKQIEKSTFYVPKRIDPDVIIKPRMMGSWSLYLDGYSRGVKVKRIK